MAFIDLTYEYWRDWHKFGEAIFVFIDPSLTSTSFK